MVDAEKYAYDDEILKKAKSWKMDRLIEINAKQNSFIFRVESTGALSPAKILLWAIDVLKQKLDGVQLGLGEDNDGDGYEYNAG